MHDICQPTVNEKLPMCAGYRKVDPKWNEVAADMVEVAHHDVDSEGCRRHFGRLEEQWKIEVCGEMHARTTSYKVSEDVIHIGE